MADSKTDKLIKRTGRISSNSSNDEIEFFGLPTGTFSAGADVTLKANDSLVLTQAKRGVSALNQRARDYLKNYRNKEQAKQVIKLLRAIEDLLKGYDDLNLPEIRISSAQDGSIALNWRVGTAFFGAAIRPNITESSWFLIQGDVEKGYKADGYLDELDYETQLPSMIQLLRNTYIRQER